jgi:hypothetical protein
VSAVLDTPARNMARQIVREAAARPGHAILIVTLNDYPHPPNLCGSDNCARNWADRRARSVRRAARTLGVLGKIETSADGNRITFRAAPPKQ